MRERFLESEGISPDLAQLGRVARQNQLDARHWSRVLTLAEATPDLPVGLARLAKPLPLPRSGNPLIDALRRLCHSSPAELAIFHRRAFSVFAGSGEPPPVAFTRLVIEEARTHMWRQNDGAPLAELARLLERGLTAADPARAALRARALAYQALFEARFFKKSASQTLAAMKDALARLPDEAELHFLGALASAVQHANDYQREEALRDLGAADAWVVAQEPHGSEAEFGELRVETGMVGAWVFAALGQDGLAAELAARSLDLLPEGADPWLRFNLCHDSARAILGPVSKRLEVDDIARDAPAMDKLSRNEKFAWLDTRLQLKVAREAAELERAIPFLEQAAPLLARFSGREGLIQQQWLEGTAWLYRDPLRAIEQLLAAFESTLKEEPGRPARIALDLMMAMGQVSRAQGQMARVRLATERWLGHQLQIRKLLGGS